jgi:pimeloyl-ACP methyl ester carboxylesterase
MRDRPSRVPLLQDYQKPTLLLGGQFDPIIPPSSLENLAVQSGVELAFLDKTAHMGMLEAPLEAYQTLIYFFKKHTSSAKKY